MLSRVRIEPPMGGLVRSTAFQRQPPFSTPYCMNVWPDSSQAQRRIVGSRDGIAKLYQTQYGSGSQPINMLSPLEISETTSTAYWEMRAGATALQGGFDTATGGLVSPLIDGENKWFYADWAASNNTAGVFRQTESDWNPSHASGFSFAMQVVPYAGEHQATYRIYFDLASTPDPTTSAVIVAVTLATSGGNDTYAVTVDKVGGGGAGQKASQSGSLSGHDTRVIQVYWNQGTTDVTVWIDGTEAVSIGQSAAITLAGGVRSGWSMTPTASGDRAIVDFVNLRYQRTADIIGVQVNRDIVGCGGSVHIAPTSDRRGDNVLDFTGSIIDDRPVFTAQRTGYLWIADHGDVLVDDASVEVFTTSGGAPYSFRIQNISSTAGASAGNFVVEVYSSGDTTILPLGTYSIASVPSGTTLLMVPEFTANPGASGAGISASIRIRRGMKYLTPSVSALGDWQFPYSATNRVDTNTKGTPPVGCHLICEYRDRLVVAGNPSHQWYMTRRGDPFDWNYGANEGDSGRAFSGTVGDTGKLPKSITALIPFRDDSMLIATADEIYAMRGDPGFGGDILPVSLAAGIVSAQAWCIDPFGALYFVGRGGMFRMMPNGLVEPVSKRAIPTELTNMNADDFKIMMAYDVERNCVLLFVSAFASTKKTYHWRFDPGTEAFWPFTLSHNYEPYIISQSRGTVLPKTVVLMGGQNGLVRFFSRQRRLDVADAFNWQLIFGPIRGASSIGGDSILAEISASLPQLAENASLTIYAGNTPQESIPTYNSVQTAGKFTATVAAGFNTGIHPRVRGAAFCVGLFDRGNGEKSAIEEMELGSVPGGRLRGA